MRFLINTCAAFVLLAVAPGCCYHAVKPLPKGLSVSSALLPASGVRFLYDQTFLDEAGVRHSDQRIFDEILALIAKAEQLVVIDMFLFNEFLGAGQAPHRRLCAELTDALIARKRAVPDLRIVLITDPVNTVYGGLEADPLRRLEAAGAEVVITRLDRLRDSNTAWSSVWRLFFKPWGNSSESGWVASPFGPGEVTLRSWLALFNFKANHRKIVVAHAGGEQVAIVTSANPHDGSSAHSNVGVIFSGPAARAALEAEQAVLRFSDGPELALDAVPAASTHASPDAVRVQVLTEEAIADAAEDLLAGAGAGDTVDVVMFYLADRPIVRALKAAAGRGVALRVTLDPNKDAFGREKSGMPNRQVARELVAAGVPVRWAVTRGEQMHSKLLLVKRADGTADLLLGSANFTRRNVRDFNLETDVRVAGRATAPALADAAAYAERLWTNAGGRVSTTGYETFRDDSGWRVFRYRFQEATGLCTW
jgi:phosphatidylserine/phosphatidylglycerophosphate/cardiolipin synthase-like enzyme